MTRFAWLAFLACLGCQGIMTQNAPATPTGTAHNDQPEERRVKAPARLADPTGQADLHLIQAAALLDQGKDTEAVSHLLEYVTRRPDQLLARAQLGELFFRLRKWNDAHLQFELFIAMAQEQGEEAFRYLIHCHSRMVEIAEQRQDDYEEHLHRGIGLYLLACRRATEPDPDGDYSANSIWCRAAGELQEARKEQPKEARPQLYLYQVWNRLGQKSAADRALAAADAHALFGSLTPHERRDLQIACLRESQPPGISKGNR